MVISMVMFRCSGVQMFRCSVGYCRDNMSTSRTRGHPGMIDRIGKKDGKDTLVTCM